MSVLGAILISAIGTAIGTFFQRKSWEHQQEVAKKEEELDAANKIFEGISTDMDTRLYSMRQVFWGIEAEKIPEEEVAERWKGYRELLVAWNTTLNKKICMIERYFGKKMSDIFEFKIQTNFRELHTLLCDYYENVDGRKDFDQEKFNKIADNLSELIRRFNVDMLRSIQKSEVGIFHPEVN